MVEKYEIDGQEPIVCQDLTYGFLVGVEAGTLEETKHDVVMDGASLSMEEVFALRNTQVNDIYEIILRLTYPMLYDEDGKRIEDTIDVDVDKKKV